MTRASPSPRRRRAAGDIVCVGDSGALASFGFSRRAFRGSSAICVFAGIALLLAASLGVASPLSDAVAKKGCAALAARVDAVAGNAPIFLRSYDQERGRGEPDESSLRTAAFSYDNALAVIALLACDKPGQAARIGEALRLAAMNDARLRNAYRAGAVENGKPLPNGWWEAKQNRWVEDAYQDGTATGNAAWTALALLALHDARGDARWREAALKLANWIVANTADTRGAGGFDGGIEGFDAAPAKALWKSTEHNIDLAALFAWLARVDAQGGWQERARQARRFVDAQWDAASGHFWIGTLTDGATANRAVSGLDVQLWSQLLPEADAQWRRALAWAERAHGVAGGFDFNDDRDGLWTEGTAQAALVYLRFGRGDEAETWFATIAQQTSTGGFVYATREPRITTGLAVGGGSADFYYYRRPHLGATAWAVLAARNRNPFAPAAARR